MKQKDAQNQIKTQRLLLKHITLADAPAVFLWTSDPAVNRFMAYALHRDVKETEAWIASIADNPFEFGFYRIADGVLIGTGGVGENADGVHELGYNLRRDAWGQGYATEAAQAMLAWAYRVHGIRDFTARHAKENTASGNVIRKCGFQLTGYGQYEKLDHSETFDTAIYTLHLKGDEAYVCR